MKTDLIAAMIFFSLSLFLFLVAPGFVEYVNQRYERDLKIACINAGNTLIVDSSIDGETK